MSLAVLGAAAITEEQPQEAHLLENLRVIISWNPINLATAEFLHASGRWFPEFWKTARSPAAAATVSPTPAISPEE